MSQASLMPAIFNSALLICIVIVPVFVGEGISDPHGNLEKSRRSADPNGSVNSIAGENPSLPGSSKQQRCRSILEAIKANSTGISSLTKMNIKPKFISSSEGLFHHFSWGEECERLSYLSSSAARLRQFSGYGPCPYRKPVASEEVLASKTLKDILEAYTEIFRFYCDKKLMARLYSVFSKGYIRLSPDNSAVITRDSYIFIRPKLTFVEMDELELVLDFAAFSHVFISWYRFPVGSIDPTGMEIPDRCFIEIVGRLHALDLLADAATRHMARFSYNMALKLKSYMKDVKTNFLAIAGTIIPKDQHEEKMRLKQCLMVCMGLLEFLSKYASSLVVKGTCAHEAFKTFYTPAKFGSYEDKLKHMNKG